MTTHCSAHGGKGKVMNAHQLCDIKDGGLVPCGLGLLIHLSTEEAPQLIHID